MCVHIYLLLFFYALESWYLSCDYVIGLDRLIGLVSRFDDAAARRRHVDGSIRRHVEYVSKELRRRTQDDFVRVERLIFHAKFDVGRRQIIHHRAPILRIGRRVYIDPGSVTLDFGQDGRLGNGLLDFVPFATPLPLIKRKL